MKHVYWKPRQISYGTLILICGASLVGLTTVELFHKVNRQPYYRQKLDASSLAAAAMDRIKDERIKRGIAIDTSVDPAMSGMIGGASTPVTSRRGGLDAKQTSVNPNFAAIVVEMLMEAGAQEGEFVSVGMSGSFPALNICVYAAIQTLKLNPIVISSAASSEWGANEPELLWIDMERILYEQKIFSFRSVAASLGGIEDKAVGMSETGKSLLRKGLVRNNLELIEPDSYGESVKMRRDIYRKHVGDNPIRAYINVGGGTAAAGRTKYRRFFKPGINIGLPAGAEPSKSVMAAAAAEDIPVIYLEQVIDLALHYGLPVRPIVMPAVGDGGIFYRVEYNHTLVVVVLGCIIGIHFALFRSRWGMRMQTMIPGKHHDHQLEPMI